MRVFINKISDEVRLTGEDHRHVSFAVRARVGDPITLCPQDGFDYEGVIEKISRDETVVKVQSKKLNLTEPSIELTVFSAVMNKPEKIELAVQKLTELGMKEFYPVMTKFVQAKAQSVRCDRLNKIALEAAKQCGRGRLPVCGETLSFDEMRRRLKDFDLVVFPYEREETLSLKEFLRFKKAVKVALVIGSEGGFSQEEADALKGDAIASVTLGNRIMRAETAVIAVASAVMYELDEWRRKT